MAPPRARAHERGERGGVDPDLLVPVPVEVEHAPRPGPSPRRSSPSASASFAPDGVAQVRQVQAAEDAVPVGVVALGAADGAAQLGGGSPVRRQSADSACIFLCIRLDSGYLTRKFRQCAPRIERAVGPGDARLAEVALEARQSQRRVGRQRPALHLAVRRGRQIGEPAARHCVERLVEPAQHDLAALHQPADRVDEPVQPAAARRPTPWCRASRRTSRRRRPAPRAHGPAPRSSRR